MRYLLAGLIVVLTALIVMIGLTVYTRDDPQSTAIESGPFGVPFTLVDHKGETITRNAFMGHPSALFVGFTHCPEICPTTLYELDGWLEQLGPDGEAIAAYFITIDPERDTAQTLDDYITSVTDRVLGITGDPEAVREMARGFSVYFKRVPLDDGDYTMDHTASIFLLDSQGRFRKTIAYGESSDTALAKLRDLANL